MSSPDTDGEGSQQQPDQRPTRGTGRRGRGRGRGRGATQSRRRRGQAYVASTIPPNAKPISDEDKEFNNWNSDFMPIREPGPHIQDGCNSELDLLRLFLPDEILDQFIRATNDYAELKRREKRMMYMRFKRSDLTVDELLWYMGVLLLLSINSVRNYRKAWERKSPQVCIHIHAHIYQFYMQYDSYHIVCISVPLSYYCS